jgi:transposase
VTAAAVFDGPIDTETVHAYVEQVLVPTLRRGDVVVLDNLAVHKHSTIRAAIAAAGALRFLPPYSPDFNPIEQAFAKLKAFSGQPGPAASTRSATRSRTHFISTRRPSAPTMCGSPATAFL